MSQFFRVIAQNPALNAVRKFLRRMPGGSTLLRLVAGGMNKHYEQRFSDALLAAIRAGDCVWDIGANVGLYTKEFLRLVGPTGKVTAVEPSAASAQKCRDIPHEPGQLEVVQAALGSSAGKVKFAVNTVDPTSVTNAISDEGDVEIELLRADDLLARTGTAPNIIKVDVEGFECDVLDGMSETFLRAPALRALFIEVHSTQMAQRGIRDGNKRLERRLAENAFRVDWVDFSHLVATRA
jgi:FkbM family methyltransferase